MGFSFITSADLTAAGLDDTTLRRATARGDLHRVCRGVFLPRVDWLGFDERERHCALVAASRFRVRSRVVASHESAGALWGFPVLDEWPSAVHVTDPSRSTGQRTRLLVRHPGRVEFPVTLRGIPCTSAARTAVDLALLRGFLPGLLASDFGLAAGLFSTDDLTRELFARPNARGHRSARAAVDLADARSGSPGESLSRGAMYERGIPPPELQKEIVGSDGKTYFLDFWWPDCGVGGEFDGDVKYLDPSMRQGRSPEQVVLDERERHYAILGSPEVDRLVRWKYATAREPAKLEAVLTAAGISRVRR